MIIRKENKQDFDQIYNLVKIAFQTAQVTNGKEQDFVNELRSGTNYIPELALVAEEDGKMVGHIMLTKAYINDGNTKSEVLYLAPVSVVLEKRSTGIGSALIKESFRIAKEMGYTSVFLVGNPDYYNRFGFKCITQFGIRYHQEIPPEFVMACELVPNALDEISGTIDCF
jgi:predicted N-acetyltransferase YhbS